MRLGVVGYAADSGVGRELIDALRHLPVACAFILPNSAKRTRTDLLRGTPCFLAEELNVAKQMELFLDCHMPDTILTWEVPGNWAFPEIWAEKGVRWVHMVHWDWFSAAEEHRRFWKSAQLLAPNDMAVRQLRADFGLEAWKLPVPVDTDRLAFRERPKADVFMSVYGYGGPRDRRSMPEIFAAWKAIQDPPTLLLRAQKKPDEAPRLQIPPNVHIEVGNTPEPAGLYEVGDVALQPSRYEGVGVSLLEAQACGMPVIATDAEPMREIAPDLLVPVERQTRIAQMGKALPSHIPSIPGIADRVRNLRGKDIRELSQRARKRVEKNFSWKALRKRWVDALEGRRP